KGAPVYSQAARPFPPAFPCLSVVARRAKTDGYAWRSLASPHLPNCWEIRAIPRRRRRRLEQWPAIRQTATQAPRPGSHPEFRGSVFDLDPGFLDYRAPLFSFRLQEGGKRGLTMLLCMGLFSI